MVHPLATLVLMSVTGLPAAPHVGSPQPVEIVPVECLASCDAVSIVSMGPAKQDEVVAVGDAIPLANGDGRLALDGRWGRTRSGAPEGVPMAALSGSHLSGTHLSGTHVATLLVPGTGTNGGCRLMRWVVVRAATVRPHRI